MIESTVSSEATAVPELFGDLLRDHRAAANLTQEELAERSGLSVHAISMLERGVRRAPRARTVEVLATALRLDDSRRATLVTAARRPLRPSAPDALPPVGDGETLLRSAGPGRRRLGDGWWLVLALQGLLAATSLVALTVAAVRTGGPAPSPTGLTVPSCTVPGGSGVCWATVTDAGIDPGAPCSHQRQVPLYLRTGGSVCLSRDEQVEITCYYSGEPLVDGDRFQDHVVEEDGGRLRYVGHVPDRFVDLHGRPPAAQGIHRC